MKSLVVLFTLSLFSVHASYERDATGTASLIPARPNAFALIFGQYESNTGTLRDNGKFLSDQMKKVKADTKGLQVGRSFVCDSGKMCTIFISDGKNGIVSVNKTPYHEFNSVAVSSAMTAEIMNPNELSILVRHKASEILYKALDKNRRHPDRSITQKIGEHYKCEKSLIREDDITDYSCTFHVEKTTGTILKAKPGYLEKRPWDRP